RAGGGSPTAATLTDERGHRQVALDRDHPAVRGVLRSFGGASLGQHVIARHVAQGGAGAIGDDGAHHLLQERRLGVGQRGSDRRVVRSGVRCIVGRLRSVTFGGVLVLGGVLTLSGVLAVARLLALVLGLVLTLLARCGILLPLGCAVLGICDEQLRGDPLLGGDG